MRSTEKQKADHISITEFRAMADVSRDKGRETLTNVQIPAHGRWWLIIFRFIYGQVIVVVTILTYEGHEDVALFVATYPMHDPEVDVTDGEDDAEYAERVRPAAEDDLPLRTVEDCGLGHSQLIFAGSQFVDAQEWRYDADLGLSEDEHYETPVATEYDEEGYSQKLVGRSEGVDSETSSRVTLGDGRERWLVGSISNVLASNGFLVMKKRLLNRIVGDFLQ